MVLRCSTDLTVITQAYAPPGYCVLKDNSTLEDISVRKRDKMRRWLCCTCHVEEPYQSHENELLKSPRNNTDGILSLILDNALFCYSLHVASLNML